MKKLLLIMLCLPFVASANTIVRHTKIRVHYEKRTPVVLYRPPSESEQILEQNKPKLVLHFGTKNGFNVWDNAVNLNLR